jgi:hypothetical protein
MDVFAVDAIGIGAQRQHGNGLLLLHGAMNTKCPAPTSNLKSGAPAPSSCVGISKIPTHEEGSLRLQIERALTLRRLQDQFANRRVYLSAPPPPATTHEQSSSVTSSQAPSVSSHLAAKYSRGQLTGQSSSRTNLSVISNEALMRELIGRHNSQDFSGAPYLRALPSVPSPWV